VRVCAVCVCVRVEQLSGFLCAYVIVCVHTYLCMNVCDFMCEEELASREQNINWKELAEDRSLLYEF
jgi:hypothetical protein